MEQRTEVVVITGASAGVGRATAQAFARHGARVALLARNRKRLEAARREVEALGGEALVIPLDVADASALEKAADQVEKRFGPIDVWVNNAMVTVFAPFTRIKPEEFKQVTEITYLGTVYGTMTALRRMVPRDRGTVVQVGSALAFRSIPLQSAYCGAKHAIRGFTDSIRVELMHEKSNVHITMVQLPGLNTPQFEWSRSKMDRKAQPVPPIFQPDVAAENISRAAHQRQREVYVGLPTLKSIWGNQVAPGLLDKYLARTNVDAQQTDQPETPGRPDNLFKTVDSDWGAHGRFDSRSKKRAVSLKTTNFRKDLSLGLLAFGGAITAGFLVKKGWEARTGPAEQKIPERPVTGEVATAVPREEKNVLTRIKESVLS